MVQTRVVRGCGSWCPGGDIRFHAFPKNSTQRNLWLSIVPLKMKYYESATVPTVIINQETVSPGKTTSALHEESIVQIAALAVPSINSDIYESSSALKETGVKRTVCNIEDQTSKKQCRKILENLCNLNKLPVSSEDDDPAKIDRGVQVKIKSSKEEILEKKSKILKQKVARQTTKNQDMSSLIATIKKYTETIRRSLSLFNCNVGFLSEVLEYLKEQVKTPEKIYLKNVVLIFDGMALRQNLAYDQKLDKVVGYVDLGPIPVSDPEKLASEALVFQIVSYGVRFKSPIAYFLLQITCLGNCFPN
ncbi:unnamed protein product [Parnassius apollo]|uniref:(apollo) hypothetical protein n=1 Tax=Parnassius apollo TaxID=110799 RepID=A0A8S3W3N7_PARAO|nr:unnamed protein product [Parnassius apollo]